MKNPRFWTALDTLVSTCEITVDRPAGTCHPRYPDLVYPLDYGYLRGSQSSDGAEVDCWVGTMQGRAVTGIVVTIDLLKRDAEVKVLLGCTSAEMEKVTAFHNRGPMAAKVIGRQQSQPVPLEALGQDLEDVGKHIRELLRHQSIRKRVMDIIWANPDFHGTVNPFWGWLQRVYADSVLITIRRLMDGDSRVVSLVNITRGVIANPDAHTRKDFVSARSALWSKGCEDASRAYTVLAGEGDRLDPDSWNRRLAETNAKCDRVWEFVNTLVAHNDREKPDLSLKWTEVNEAIDAVVVFYWQLKCLIDRIGSESLVGWTPEEIREHLTVKPEDAQLDDIFRIPWIPPRQD